MHWGAEYIGKPHVIGARGPDTFDCWGLLREIYQTRFSITLPDLPGISAMIALTISREIDKAAEQEWDSVPIPFDGCAVAMSQSKAYHHVGVFIGADGGKILHCWNGQSVVADTSRRLRLKGLKKITFFKHRLWPT